MSKTHKDVVKMFDNKAAKKRNSEAVRRFKREKSKTADRLFKRELHFTTYLERTAQED